MDLRVEKGRATRDRLLAVARRLFGERGYDATSIDAVLREAGVARGALYHHFATKEALFDAVLDRVVADIAEATVREGRRGGDAAARLAAGCAAWLGLALDPAIQRIVLLDAPAVVGWARLREIDEHHTLGTIKRALAAIGDRGGADLDVDAHMLLAAVNEAALYVSRAEDPEAALAAAHAAVERLIARIAR